MSKRVRFLADYDHKVRTSVVVAYKVGMCLSVPDKHAVAAVAAGKAEIVPDAHAGTPPT